MASRSQIQGITVKIEGDTSPLAKSLKNVNSEISQTSRALKDVEKALKLDPGNTELLAQKQDLLNKQIEQTEEKLRLEKRAAEDAKDALELGQISKEEYATLQAELVKTESSLNDLQGAAEDSGEEVEEAGEAAERSGDSWSVFGSVVQGAAQAITTYMIDALRDAVSALSDFARDSVEVGMTFDSSMSQVAATMGTTVDQIQDLRDYAIEMGSSTAFSASQAADALNYMALAGYDADTAMAMLPNVLNLAAAGGIDLASASDMVTDVSSALSLSIEDTAVMIDQMARASSSSNLSVQQLGEALLTLGATGAAAEGGTEELATVLGVLADNGIKGAKGGTELRNIILSLTTPTSSAADALAQLGISAYDDMGNMRSLIDIIGDLQVATSDMSRAERDNIVGEIFNRGDMAAINSLLDTTIDRFYTLGDAIEDSQGAASQMAETQLDNLAGDVTKFQSALEGAQIMISDALTPALREVVEFGTDGIDRLTEAFEADGLDGALSVVEDLFQEALELINTYMPSIQAMAGNILNTFAGFFTSNLDTILNTGMTVLMTLVTGIVNSLPQLVPVALNLIMNLSNFLVSNLPFILQAGIDLIVGLAQAIGSSAPELIPMVVQCINQIVTTLLDNLDEILLAGMQLLIGLGLGIVAAIPDMLAFFPEVFTAIQDTITDFFEGLWESASTWGADMIGNFISGITSGFSNLTSAVSNAASIVADYLHFSVPSRGPLHDFDETMGEDMLDNFIRGMTNSENDLRAAVSSTANVIYDGMSQPDYSGALSGISSQIAGLGGGSAPQVINVWLGSTRLGSVVVDAQTQENYRAGGI